MSDFDDFEVNSDDLYGADKSDNNKNDDDFKLPDLPQTTQKNLSIINFSALKPPTGGSSITISDATNESLNFSRPPLLPARLTSMMTSTPSQNLTSPAEENKPKFDLPPLFDDLDDDDDDSNEVDQPNLGPIQFPSDPDLDKKDNNGTQESKDKMDSITINSVSNIPESPLKMNNFFADDNHEQDNNLNELNKPSFLPNLSTSLNNESKVLDNFEDEINAPHPLIPSRKKESASPFPSPLNLNHSSSKPSFLNINEIKNIKPGDPVSSSVKFDSTPNLSPVKIQNNLSAPVQLPNLDSQSKTSSEDHLKDEKESDSQNVNLNVVNVDDDDNIEFSSISLSDHSEDEKKSQPKADLAQKSEETKDEPQQQKLIPDRKLQAINQLASIQSTDQKAPQNNMNTDLQRENPPQNTNQQSSLNDSDISNNFFMESDTTQPSKSQQNESEKAQLNQSVFHTNPNPVETFQSNLNDSNPSQPINKSDELSNDDFEKPIDNSIQQKKSTPPNNGNRKPKTELAESVQKVKQMAQQSAKKQQQQKQSNESTKKEENRIQKQNQQLISPPIKSSTETPLNSASQSPSPPNSSSESFHENEQNPPNSSNKTQTIVNMTKPDEQLSSVSLHLSSDQHTQNHPVKKIVPKMAIEIGVENAFDNASAQFQRLFMNEFASLMRPTYQMPYDTDIDNFVDYLSKDINKELNSITKSFSPTTRKVRGFSHKIDLLFDQGRDVLNEKLANSYEDDLQRRAQNYQKLRNLQTLVDDLNKNFTAKVTKTMKVIDNYLKDSALIRSNKLMKAQMLQKNLRELTIERMHLEAKVNKQLSEFEEIDRQQNEVMMSYISFSNDPNTFDSDDQQKSFILKKIAREITLISSNVDKATFESLIDMSNDAQFQLNEERTKIRHEYSRMDGFAEKLKLLKQRKQQAKKSSSKKKESSKKKS